MRDSILLRERAFPFRWHALAEVKLEAQDRARGLSLVDGRLLLFIGKSPRAFQVVTVLALNHRGAERRVIEALRRETKAMSQRGVHLLPLDSMEASRMLSLKLKRLRSGSVDWNVVPTDSFDVLALQASDGILLRKRAFRAGVKGGPAFIPPVDATPMREPLLAEVVEAISERHGWANPDEFSPFLASLDASRAEPLAERLTVTDGADGTVSAVSLGGAQVKLTRSQLRAVARVYA